jgi:hypothetical protein
MGTCFFAIIVALSALFFCGGAVTESLAEFTLACSWVVVFAGSDEQDDRRRIENAARVI